MRHEIPAVDYTTSAMAERQLARLQLDAFGKRVFSFANALEGVQAG